MHRNKLKLEPPQSCSLGQALLWMDKQYDPILEISQYPDLVKKDVDSYLKMGSPIDAQEALYVALSQGMIKSKGYFYVDGEKVIPIGETRFFMKEIVWDIWALDQIDWNESVLKSREMFLREEESEKPVLDIVCNPSNYKNCEYRYIRLSTSDLFDCFKEGDWLAELDAELDRNSDIENANNIQRKSKNSGGRKPKYDWEEFYVEVAVLGDLDALPSTQSELIETMSDWCENVWGEIPSSSMLKEKISRIYNHPRKLVDN